MVKNSIKIIALVTLTSVFNASLIAEGFTIETDYEETSDGTLSNVALGLTIAGAVMSFIGFYNHGAEKSVCDSNGCFGMHLALAGTVIFLVAGLSYLSWEHADTEPEFTAIFSRDRAPSEVTVDGTRSNWLSETDEIKEWAWFVDGNLTLKGATGSFNLTESGTHTLTLEAAHSERAKGNKSKEFILEPEN